MHRSRRNLAKAALGLAALPTFARAQAAPLRIGAINPYTGPVALYGDEVARGYQLAVDEANARGGVLGRQVELVRGDAGNPQQGIAVVEKLATQDKVDAFIGTYISAVSNAASDAALRYNRLYWDTNALAQDLTERGLPNFVRSGPNARIFADFSAEGVRNLLAPAIGKTAQNVTVWLEHEDSVYGTSIAQQQRALLEKAGVKVLGVGAHNFRANDLTDSVLRAKRADPDVWVNTGYVPDTNLLLRTMRDQGFAPKAVMLVGTGDTFETLEALGAQYLDGVVVVGYPRPDVAESFGPGAAAYLDAYRKKYNREPIAPQGMAAYTGMRIMLETIAAAGSAEPDKVRAAAQKMDKPFGSYPTGFGVKFDDKMQNTRANPTIVQWQGGKAVTVFPKEAVQGGVKLVNLPRK
jgi:branched-chain amino acid transport system substrate-binding protein